jgi:hypothetical protein
MKVIDVYTRFKNPPNLQQHMLQVAKVGLFIQEHWKAESIDKVLLTKVLLLHDIGNIVKFDIQRYPHFLGEAERERAGYWLQVQKEIIQKYGSDDHEVTEKMLQEANIDPEVIKIVVAMSYTNAVTIAASQDWILKILLYADLRVSPTGIISLKDRLDDVHTRLPKYKERNDLYDAGFLIEQQIQSNLNVPVSDITDEKVAVDDALLLHTTL